MIHRCILNRTVTTPQGHWLRVALWVAVVVIRQLQHQHQKHVLVLSPAFRWMEDPTSIEARDARLKTLGLKPNSALAEGSAFTEEEEEIFERVRAKVPAADVEAFDATWQDRLIRGLWTHNKGTADERFAETTEAFEKIARWRREKGIDDILTRRLKGLDVVMKHIQMTAGGDDLYGHVVWVEQLVDVAKLCSCELTTEEIVLVRAQATEAMESLKVQRSTQLGLTRYKQVYVLDVAPLAFGPLIRRGDVRKLTGEIMGLGSAYYPEGMWKIFIINTPLIFRTVYAIVSPMINAVTREKIKILGPPSKYLKEMEKNGIPLNSVPKIVGGNHPGRSMLQEISDQLSGVAPDDDDDDEEEARARDEPEPVARPPPAPTSHQPRAAPKSRHGFLCCAAKAADVEPQDRPAASAGSRTPAVAQLAGPAQPRAPPADEVNNTAEESEVPSNPNLPALVVDRRLAVERQRDVVRAGRLPPIEKAGKVVVVTSFVLFVFWFVYF